MRTERLLLSLVLCGSLLACGRSDLDGSEPFPSVLDQPAGNGGGGAAGKGGASAGGASAGPGGASTGGASTGGASTGGAGPGGTAGKGGGTGGVSTGGAGGQGNSGGSVIGGSAGSAAVGNTGGTGGKACQGVPVPDPPCQSCVDGVCCAQSEACNQDPQCRSLLKCLFSCTDASCQESCYQTFPGGLQPFQPLAKCVENNCGVACGGGGAGGVAGSGGSTTGGSGGGSTCDGIFLPVPQCQACLDTVCCAQSEACNQNPQCEPLLYCILSCNDDALCQNECVQKYPGGLPEVQKLGGCADALCKGACDGSGGAGGGTGGTAGTGGVAGTGGSTGGTGGSTGGTGGGGGASCDQLGTGSPECDACYQSQCCSEGSACLDSTSCVDLLICLNDCGENPACQQNCFQQQPEGYQLLVNLSDCINNSCSFECNGGGGGSSGGGGSGGSGAGGGTGGTGGSPSFCGNGLLEPGEQCDQGPENGDYPALRVTGFFPASTTPVSGVGNVVSFYNYFSASSHTGYEQVSTSRAMLHRDLSTGQLSLVMHHGIDADGTGVFQPQGQAAMKILGLPPGAFISVVDDTKDEFSFQGPSFVMGNWTFQQNSDGGAISGLPFPGDWTITLSSSFTQGIQQWQWVDGSGGLIDLPMNSVVTVQAFSYAGVCRTNCTVPYCGDGVVDGGEVCDDGNPFDGDGCSSDCKSTPFIK